MTLPSWTRSERFCSLTTYRRTGEAVATPMWFAADGDRLVMQTAAGSPKVRRLDANPRVQIAPCTRTGTLTGAAVPARAAQHPGEMEHVRSLLLARYGLQYRLLHAVQAVSARVRRRPPAPITTITVTVEDLGDAPPEAR